MRLAPLDVLTQSPCDLRRLISLNTTGLDR